MLNKVYSYSHDKPSTILFFLSFKINVIVTTKFSFNLIEGGLVELLGSLA
jgi:hypothetical protein